MSTDPKPPLDQKEQQSNPDLQSYTSGGDNKAADPEQNIIIQGDPRYEKDPDEKPGAL